MTHSSGRQHYTKKYCHVRSDSRDSPPLDKKRFKIFEKLLNKIKEETGLKGVGLEKYTGLTNPQMCDFNVRKKLTVGNAKKILAAFNKMKAK